VDPYLRYPDQRGSIPVDGRFTPPLAQTVGL
jgi:hypothetical protein